MNAKTTSDKFQMHAPSGSWTHDLTLHPIITGEESVSWAIDH